MVDTLGSVPYSHLRRASSIDVGHDADAARWIHRVRDLGGLLFLDVRDRHGLTQVMVPNDSPVMATAKKLRSVIVVAVSGKVRRRDADTVNVKIATGEVEVVAGEIRLLNEAKTPQFPIADETPVSEDVRLRFRYLDLRRPACRTTSGCATASRSPFASISTPRASGRSRRRFSGSPPEGARDYLVPSRVHPGEFFALPQSPRSSSKS